MRALDLFCGAGGATKGLQRAGFHVTGIDLKPQPRYCGDAFIVADALRLPVRLSDFDLIWASPPCQRYTVAQNAAKNADAHPDLVAPVRELLFASGRLFIIENVPGAPLVNPVILCGLSFGLKVKRHRLFEMNFFALCPPCPSHNQDFYTIFGHASYPRGRGGQKGKKNNTDAGRAAMGCEWMNRDELSEAIPPAYAEHLGRAAMAILKEGYNAKGNERNVPRNA